MDKPTSVTRVETITAIAKIINESHLPPYVLIPILEDFLSQATQAQKEQYAHDLARWNDYMATAEKEGE